jgi:hypothetical protein
MRRGAAFGIGAVVVLALAGVLLWHALRGPASPAGASTTSAGARDPIPAAAAAAVQLLVSATGHTALTPGLGASVGRGRLFPAGTTFTVQPGSWQQTGAYANLTGTVRVPGRAPDLAEVGLVRRGSRWLVTFEGAPQ